MNTAILRQLPGRLARRGYVTILTLCFLSIGTTLAGGFYCMLQSSIAIAADDEAAAEALAAAESGMQFMQYQLIKASAHANLNGSSGNWLDTISAGLVQNLEGTLKSNILATGQVDYNPSTRPSTSTLTIPKAGTPALRLQDGSTFTSTVTGNASGTHLILTVTGQDRGAKARRVLQIGINANPPIPADLSGFAMIAKGKITLNNNAMISGYDPTTNTANSLIGRVYFPWGETGSSVVALQDPSAPAMVFENPPPLNIPQVDVSFLAGMKGSRLSHYTAPSGNPKTETLTNCYITSDRTFSADVVINGILYVDGAHSLAFNGNVTLNGVIVYQRSTSPSSIAFSRGSVVTNSATVSASQLANAALGLTSDQLAVLRGWSILAPDTDLMLANGNAAQKAFGGSLHIHNLANADGQGGAGATLCLNRANIICEGNVDMSGNRVFWILPPGQLAGSESLGHSNYLYTMTETYFEP